MDGSTSTRTTQDQRANSPLHKRKSNESRKNKSKSPTNISSDDLMNHDSCKTKQVQRSFHLYLYAALILIVAIGIHYFQRSSGTDSTHVNMSEMSDNEPTGISSPSESSIPPSTFIANQCGFYLAKSKIPNAGLGVFTSRALAKGDKVNFKDPVLQIYDLNPYFGQSIATLLYDYAWDSALTGGQYEGKHVYSIMSGIGMLPNGHQHMYNIGYSHRKGAVVDHSGVTRTSPSRGASTHYHDFEFTAATNIAAGGELLIDYGVNWFKEREIKGRVKTVENVKSLSYSLKELYENGICLDRMYIKQSEKVDAGRGAFASRPMKKGEVVAPAPVVQILDKRSLDVIRIKQGQAKEEEQVLKLQLLNYCFGHRDSSLLFFPYSPMVNYINHDDKASNVELRWSTSSQHDRADVHNMSFQYIKDLEHAGLMLEFVATRDIEQDEEIYLDYGPLWQNAWESHVQNFDSDNNSNQEYIYAHELNASEKVIRTQQEQQTHPYPQHIFISCYYNYEDAMKRNQKINNEVYLWTQTSDVYDISNLRPCIILDRRETKPQEYVYTVGIMNHFGLKEAQRIPPGQKHIIAMVPRNAIKFSHRIYTTDQHLEDSFRHEIHLKDEIFPTQWLDLKKGE
ncbi:hypothetical protein CTEN210_13392 [Chaetoceros tenuissimus]|uniref:SET domain-containing protein n=1 Tax=Chaetoceros tenuissimus TaxID=426638 RepID=A0AAD3D543_9STRA|nr:hypothetical protein CTEN210_13392 [Chaetoceros tenuissimus]